MDIAGYTATMQASRQKNTRCLRDASDLRLRVWKLDPALAIPVHLEIRLPSAVRKYHTSVAMQGAQIFFHLRLRRKRA